ncbi:MAG: helix-turn-helix domain-containing protein [Flavobacteriales bacterium]|nr:helix-turn-helix domain-containing protein [Flavobacteriales bacterium]
MREEEIAQYHLHQKHPEKLQFEIHSLEEYVLKNRHHNSTPHSHSFYQIIWFHKEGKHFVDFKCYDIKENSVLFVAKNQIHSFDKETEHKGILIHFNERFLMQSDVDIFLKYKVFNEQNQTCYQINKEVIQQSEILINQIRTELMNQDKFAHQQLIRYYLKSLLIVLERMQGINQATDIKLTSDYDLKYFRFRELLEEHYNKSLTVSEYSDLLNVSTKTLTSITKAVKSKLPSELIAQRIILQAERLLSFTPLKINEIAYQLGFEDASYFVKFFKRHLTQSPSEYRKAILKAKKEWK